MDPGARAATAALTRIEGSERVKLEFATEIHHRRAHAWLERLASHAISYTEAVSFAVVEALRCAAVLTFDHDFVQAGFSRWTSD